MAHTYMRRYQPDAEDSDVVMSVLDARMGELTVVHTNLIAVVVLNL